MIYLFDSIGSMNKFNHKIKLVPILFSVER